MVLPLPSCLASLLLPSEGTDLLAMDILSLGLSLFGAPPAADRGFVAIVLPSVLSGPLRSRNLCEKEQSTVLVLVQGEHLK